MPATVQAILAARIDRLAARGQAPAPGRRRHRQGRAVRAAPGDRGRARGAASPRARSPPGGEFLYETSLFPDLEYTFKHALTQEVAYGSLLQERRRALHARVVEAIERLWPGGLAEHVERLAHHALRGEVWEKAAPVSPSGRGEGDRAVGATETAVGVLAGLARSSALTGGRDARPALKLDACLELRSARRPLGQSRDSASSSSEAEALARALDDAERGSPRSSVRQAEAVAFTGVAPGHWSRPIDRAREAIERARPAMI